MIQKLSPLLILVFACSCIMNTSSPGVLLATRPPGARVLLNGQDSGFATPCTLDLDGDTEVTFQLEGYQDARRQLLADRVWHRVRWKDGDIGPQTWRFPLFLTFGGLFFPWRYETNLFPERVYVPLEVSTGE